MLVRGLYRIGSAAFGMLSAIGSFIAGVVAKFRAINLLDVAKNLMKSFADAITAGAGWVWDAIKNVGKGILTTIEKALEMGSPSKAMKRRGRWTIQGYVGGVETEAPTVQRAFADIKPAALSMGGDVSNVTTNAPRSLYVEKLIFAPVIKASGSEMIPVIRAEVARMFDAVSGGGLAMEGGA